MEACQARLEPRIALSKEVYYLYFFTVDMDELLSSLAKVGNENHLNW